jgi:hypothetical protein
MFCVSYTFVSYLLTLPRTVFERDQINLHRDLHNNRCTLLTAYILALHKIPSKVLLQQALYLRMVQFVSRLA